MIWLLKFLILGHVHKWETLREGGLTVVHENGFKEEGRRYFCRCTGCGVVLNFDCH